MHSILSLSLSLYIYDSLLSVSLIKTNGLQNAVPHFIRSNRTAQKHTIPCMIASSLIKSYSLQHTVPHLIRSNKTAQKHSILYMMASSTYQKLRLAAESAPLYLEQPDWTKAKHSIYIVYCILHVPCLVSCLYWGAEVSSRLLIDHMCAGSPQSEGRPKGDRVPCIGGVVSRSGARGGALQGGLWEGGSGPGCPWTPAVGQCIILFTKKYWRQHKTCA